MENHPSECKNFFYTTGLLDPSTSSGSALLPLFNNIKDSRRPILCWKLLELEVGSHGNNTINQNHDISSKKQSQSIANLLLM